MKHRQLGFALLELMVATIILCGLVYMFIAFTQGQQRQMDSQNVGKHLAMAINALISQTATSGCSGTQTLSHCANLSPNFQTVLRNDHLDPDAAVTINDQPS